MTSMFVGNLSVDANDDPAFVESVGQIITGAVVTHTPAEAWVFKIDHWFDHKWLAFSGKIVGAVGSWRKELTIPPFVANRIVHQLHFERDHSSGVYQLTRPGKNIHHKGSSAENLSRSVKQIAPNSALFWYSGGTLEMRRGSLMGYIPVEDDVWPWFLAFVRNGQWRVARRKSIHEYEVRLFQSAGESHVMSAKSGSTADK